MAGLPALHLAIPASAGAQTSSPGPEQLRAFLAARLEGRFSVEVTAIGSYAAIGRELLSGRAQVGWAPPIVAARVELSGGFPLVQPVRNGSVSYQAALVCRRDHPIDVASCFELRAAWVDRDSTAGYLLPRAWARGQGA